MEWTEERVARLKALWTEGRTASQIAAIIGDITRNAVIGKVHRLGLKGRPSPIRKEKISTPTPKSTEGAPWVRPTLNWRERWQLQRRPKFTNP